MSTTPTCELTPGEMFDSLTGFDEIAVVKMFGRPITDYARKGRTPNPLMLLRALVAVHHKRENGVKDAESYKVAMTMRSDAVSGYFAEDPDAEDDDEDEGPELDAQGLELGDDEGKARSGD